MNNYIILYTWRLNVLGTSQSWSELRQEAQLSLGWADHTAYVKRYGQTDRWRLAPKARPNGQPEMGWSKQQVCVCTLLQITVDEHKLGVVLSDLSQRHGHILAINVRQNTRIVTARAALAELRNYSTTLRTITSGLASFSMELAHYEQMSKENEQKTVRAVTGLTWLHLAFTSIASVGSALGRLHYIDLGATDLGSASFSHPWHPCSNCTSHHPPLPFPSLSAPILPSTSPFLFLLFSPLYAIKRPPP